MRAELRGLPNPQWFHHGEQLLGILEMYRPMVCVELGTHAGGSAIATALLIRSWGGRLYCIDRWDGDVSMVECAKNIERAGVTNIELVRCSTEDAARGWEDKIDYFYVDAGHTYAECKRDLELWWPFLRPGGVIAGDDYDDPHGSPSEGVTAAWDDFEREQNQIFNRTYSGELIGCQCEKCRAGRLIWGVKR